MDRKSQASELTSFVVYRQRLLPASETFIPGQDDSVPGWRPCYLGFQKHDGLSLAGRTMLHEPSGNRTRDRAELSTFITTGRVAGSERTLKSLRPALIHAHFGIDATQCLTFAKRNRLPLVATFHGYDITVADDYFKRTKAGRYYLSRRSRLFEEASLVIAISDYIRERLLAAGADPARTVRHYIGVDVPGTARPLAGRSGILFVGRLVEKKGAHTLLHAIAALPAAGRPLLTLVGDGPERARLMELAGRLQVKAAFVGPQPHTAVMERMDRARILCMPSMRAPDGDDEGLGLVGLEAQARQLPIFASRTGGIPEFVSDGDTGVLLPPDDATAWSAALGRYYDDETLLERLAVSGRASVTSRFNRTAQSRLLADLFVQCSGQGSRFRKAA